MSYQECIGEPDQPADACPNPAGHKFTLVTGEDAERNYGVPRIRICDYCPETD